MQIVKDAQKRRKNSSEDILRIKIFGRLTVIKKAGLSGRSKEIMWTCLCECGNFKEASTSALMRRDIVSCGCFKRDRAKKMFEDRSLKLPLGHSARNHLYCRYRLEAAGRKLAYELTIEEFESLTTANCTYCNDKPSQVCKPHKTGQYVYNGIDRVDSSIGYIRSNCVTACGVCNRMKMALTMEEFTNKIKKIYKHLKLGE